MTRDDLPGWTCPALDRLAALIDTYVTDPDDKVRGLILIETMRVAHVQLRHVATASNPKRAAAEVARLEERIAALTAGRTP